MPRSRRYCDSAPKHRLRTLECSPSVPTTRSNERDGPSRNVTSTRSEDWSTDSMTSPNMMSTSRTCSIRISHRVPRTISRSSPTRCPNWSPLSSLMTLPSRSTSLAPCICVLAASTASCAPIWCNTSRAVPRTSILYPPVTSVGARSTIVGLNPYRRSQWAAVSPAIPAPDSKTSISSDLPPSVRESCGRPPDDVNAHDPSDVPVPSREGLDLGSSEGGSSVVRAGDS